MERRLLILIVCATVLAGVVAEVGLTRRGHTFGHVVHLTAAKRHDEVAAVRRDVDWTRDVATYNCAGLAFRTYRDMSLGEVESTLSKFRRLDRADAACPPGWLKVWVWEYDVHHETEDGVVEESHRDGHVVAGRTSPVDGSGPEFVLCKYGAGPVLGPATPESWVPPAREELGRNYRGAQVYVVREHVTERWYTGPASALPK